MLDDASSKTTNAAPEGASERAGALTLALRSLRGEPPGGKEAGKIPARREPRLESPLSVDDRPFDARDAERVAFAMWREGRTDDAIAFLEREILLEKDRVWKRDTFSGRREPTFGTPAPKVIVPPPPAEDVQAKGRRRKRSRDAAPVSEPVFSDASAPLIELAAETVAIAPDAPPLRERMGSGPAIVAALGLVIVGFAAAANYWDNHRAELERAATAVEAATPQQTVPPPTVVATPPKAASVTPPKAEAAPSPPTGLASLVPTPAEAPTPVAELEQAVALATPEEPLPEDSATPPDEFDEAAPATEAPVAVARLPSPRPEPPAGLAIVAPPPAPVHQIAPSTPVYVPPDPAAGGLPLPFYSDNGLPARETLTPAEYQALLERRAVAEDYVARRRAAAEDAVPPERRVLLRLLRR